MASAICSVQRMPERSIRSLIRFFTRAFNGTTGDRPAVGEVLVIAHAGAVPVEVIGDSLKRLPFGSREAAFGDTLPEPLDYLAHIAFQDSQGAVHDPKLGLQAGLGMEDISGFPQFFQRVYQVEDQCDLQLPVDPNLEGALAIGQCYAGFGC